MVELSPTVGVSVLSDHFSFRCPVVPSHSSFSWRVRDDRLRVLRECPWSSGPEPFSSLNSLTETSGETFWVFHNKVPRKREPWTDLPVELEKYLRKVNLNTDGPFSRGDGKVCVCESKRGVRVWIHTPLKICSVCLSFIHFLSPYPVPLYYVKEDDIGLPSSGLIFVCVCGLCLFLLWFKSFSENRRSL